MMIQYGYALLTMVPVPLWFWSRWASAVFLLSVFTWSVYNGAVYYIDIFGVRFQKELETLKKDVAKWQLSPELAPRSPIIGMAGQISSSGYDRTTAARSGEDFSLGASALGEKDYERKTQNHQDGTSSATGTGFSIDNSDLVRAAAANAMKGGTESNLAAGHEGLERRGGADGVITNNVD